MDMTALWGLIAMAIIAWLGLRFSRKRHQNNSAVSTSVEGNLNSCPEPPRFFGRLKTDIGPVVWAISEEDHFLRVYGEKGSEKILYRFSDAVHDLKDYKGASINLGHWALNEAIDHTVVEGEQMFVVLKNNVRLPVCGTYRRVLEDSGLA